MAQIYISSLIAKRMIEISSSQFCQPVICIGKQTAVHSRSRKLGNCALGEAIRAPDFGALMLSFVHFSDVTRLG